MIDWSGIFHIMATPFTDDGALDVDGIPGLVDQAVATGIRGVTILGIAGEAHRLTDDERRLVVEHTVKEVAGRLPVAVGVSAPGLHVAAAFARMAHEHGADAVMVAPPNGVRNLDAVADYYQAVAAAAGLPVVLQDEPVTTQVTMPAPFIARLVSEVAAIEAIKLEEAPTLPKITRLRELLRPRTSTRPEPSNVSRTGARPLPIFGGLGGVYFFEELSRGADGAMTGFPYPDALGEILHHFAARRRAEARRLFYRWLPLIRYESQPGAVPGTSLAIRKDILRRRGWIRSSYVRPPAPALDRETFAELDELLQAVSTGTG